MSKRVVFVLCLGLLLLVFGAIGALGQEEEEAPLIITTASDSVGIGTYVAAQAFAAPAGDDPATQPVVSIIIPYGIYPDMHVTDVADFHDPETLIEGFTFAWSLAPADGSSAALLAEGNVAIFLADVAGTYDLTLTATDENGNAGDTTWRVYATTYVGAGGISGEEHNNCITCHEDKWSSWDDTGHSDMLTRGLEGTLSDHYNEGCIGCHTTGFNAMPEAANGGFDDLAADHGWAFPEELTEGNWDALVAEFPGVAALANIQCESCHGPGYLHATESTRNERMISRGLDYGVCAQCHAEDPYHVFPQQWETSSHGELNSRGFTYPIGENRQSCVRCHSGAGFIDYVSGVPEGELRTDYQPITCAVCHDPHDVSNPNQLRVFDSVLLPDGTDVTDAGPAATCMTCHNVRRDGGAPGQVASVVAGGRFSNPHHSNSQAGLLNFTGGYTWGETLPTSTHGRVVEDTCIGCHMADTPGMDNMGTPDDRSDDQPLPGHNSVGEHSFAMSNEEGVMNVAVCQQCHDYAESFEFEAQRDYDGDGAIETNQEEVAGLREMLLVAMQDAGARVEGSRDYDAPEGMDEVATENFYGSLWNYYFTEMPSVPVHNMRYSVALLQLSYEKLVGEPVPNAYILSPK